MDLVTTTFEEVTVVRGVSLPAGTRFRQIIVTGPSGSGKSSMIRMLGGWPEEGCIDLSTKGWWRTQSLGLRPREVHLAVPLVGHQHAVSRFDEGAVVDTSRIQIPPAKRFFFSADWRGRYVFEFRLLPVDSVLDARSERADRGTHPGDASVNRALALVEREIYATVALHLHESGLSVYVRESFDGPPRRIVGVESDERGEASA
jgi:energy-coupling factor transporter ATP-binding protein EcfA2